MEDRPDHARGRRHRPQDLYLSFDRPSSPPSLELASVEWIDFTPGSLPAYAAGWQTVRPSSAAVAEEPGDVLAITSQWGDLRAANNNAANVLVRDVGTRDFTATVTVENRPATYATGAGLVVYLDDNSYVAILRSNYGTPRVRLLNETNGGLAEREVPDPGTGPLRLRLQRVGTQVTVSFSQDGTAWTPVSPAVTNTMLDPTTELKVGVLASKGTYTTPDPTIRFSGFTLDDEPVAFFADH
ncbi:DUF1349 domain-containing protein [Xylanimonas allomyrinae]|uniref:beta-xylosidase family glycoside hydrolase n=1 Tax=Xylanimonas allomyrinae TaxID=2509459 RepID=UPI001FE5E35A|nr:hypothetical protein [Xylanimonas allomyrinae]